MFSQLDAGLAVLRVASRFLDLTEVKDNATWSEPVLSDELVTLMREVGWQEGWPYCAAFVEACYVSAYRQVGAPERVVQLIRKCFTPSVMQTYRNCGVYAQQQVAVPGSVFFMQKGTTGLGHAGLVLLAGTRTMSTIEGNTSPGVRDAASDREGDGIYPKVRSCAPAAWKQSNGLWLRGFLHPLAHDDAVALAERVG